MTQEDVRSRDKEDLDARFTLRCIQRTLTKKDLHAMNLNFFFFSFTLNLKTLDWSDDDRREIFWSQ